MLATALRKMAQKRSSDQCLIVLTSVFLAVQYQSAQIDKPLVYQFPAYHSSPLSSLRFSKVVPQGKLLAPEEIQCFCFQLLQCLLILLSLISLTIKIIELFEGFSCLTSIIQTFAMCHCSHSFYPNHSLNSCKEKNRYCVRIIYAY